MARSFDILAAEYRPMVLSYLRAVLRDEHIAEDLTQETFLAAHRKIDSFDANRNFGAWLRGIARNVVLQDRRAVARHPLVVDSCVVEGMEQVYTLFDDTSGPWDARIRRVRRCIGLLSENLESAIVAVYGRGQSIRQASSGLGISVQAVAKRLSRARDLIRECVERDAGKGAPSPSKASISFEEKETQHVRTR